jgi:hypothetical protein
MKNLNKILRFVELVKESMEVDDTSIKDLTNEISDELDIEFTVDKGYLSPESLKKGVWGDLGQMFKQPTHPSDKKCYKISIDLLKSKVEYCTPRASDIPIFESTKVFQILHELSQINQRVKDCYIQFSGYRIDFFICSDEEVQIDETGLYKLYTEIKYKINNLRSDFGYNTTVKMEDDKIIIKTDMDSYTDRKLNLALRGIDILGKYKMTKVIGEGGWRGLVFNTIELK